MRVSAVIEPRMVVRWLQVAFALVVEDEQRLMLCGWRFTAVDVGSVPGGGT